MIIEYEIKLFEQLLIENRSKRISNVSAYPNEYEEIRDDALRNNALGKEDDDKRWMGIYLDNHKITVYLIEEIDDAWRL